MGKCTVHMKKRIDEGNSRNIFLTMARFFHGETYFTWKVKHELQVASSNPRVTSSNPRVTSSNS